MWVSAVDCIIIIIIIIIPVGVWRCALLMCILRNFLFYNIVPAAKMWQSVCNFETART